MTVFIQFCVHKIFFVWNKHLEFVSGWLMFVLCWLGSCFSVEGVSEAAGWSGGCIWPVCSNRGGLGVEQNTANSCYWGAGD